MTITSLGIAFLILTNVVTLATLGGVYWRKRVWKRRAKIASWEDNVLLHNMNRAADWVERFQAWSNRQKPQELKSKDWPEKFDE
jgi:hypothetical protein